MTRAALSERGYVVGARVGCEHTPHHLGTVVDVPGASLIAVRWDNGEHEQRSWLSLAPLGFVLPAREVRRLVRSGVAV